MFTVNLDPDASCPWCGEPSVVELAEIWTSHEFMLATCCPSLHDWLIHEMNADAEFRLDLLRDLGANDLLGSSLRRVADHDGLWLLDCHLRIAAIGHDEARRFVAQHHAHCRAPVAWRFATAVWNGRWLLGVVMVGNPVARAYARAGVLEINRLCVRRDAPRTLRWNAASKLLGWAAQEAERRGVGRLITYTRIDEDGASLRASGWRCEARVRGRGWHGGRRSRNNVNAWIDKNRWSKALRPRTARAAPAIPSPAGDSTTTLHLSLEAA